MRCGSNSIPLFQHAFMVHTLFSRTRKLSSSIVEVAEMASLLCWFHVVLLSALSAPAITFASNTTTLLALLALKESIHSDPSSFLSSWTALSSDYCAWQGVICSPGTQNLVALLLDSKMLAGSLTLRFTNIPSLLYLNVSNNSFAGFIPPSIGHLSSLTHLDLSLNDFSGFIPASLSNCSQLQYLDLSKNRFSGTFPHFLVSITPLVFLDLSKNPITGSLPADLGRLANIELFQLYSALLTGPVPDSFANCTKLVWFDIQSNQISGTLPSDWSRLTRLQIFHLQNNFISGSLPPSLGNCTNLIEIDISNNSLTGELPESYGNLVKLRGLILYYNHISGHIPSSITNCTSLISLEMSYNNFSGSIPHDIGKLTHAQWITLKAMSSLGGSIPESIGNCGALVHLYMQDTQVGGSLPSSLFNLTSLQEIKLTSCAFTGTLPDSIGNLTSLRSLFLDNNGFEGPIPVRLRQLHSLEGLKLNDNKLSGALPPPLGECARLSVLDVSGNALSGILPTSFSNLQFLNELNLHSNRFYGNIPDIFDSLSRLGLLDISHNNFTGSIPPSLARLHINKLLDLSDNALTGAIPLTLGGMQMAQTINLSHNLLDGLIPSTLGDCQGLVQLDLSVNHLQGDIPDTISKLGSLQSLILYNNALSGSLPPSFGQMGELLSLNVSFNRLVGSIPQNGVYKKFPYSSFMGNPRLCGPPSTNDCPLGDSQNKEVRNIAIASASCGAFLLLVICAGCSWWCCWKQREKESHKDTRLQDVETDSFDLEKPTYRAWTAEELRTATDNFDSCNVIGSGAVSVCYKGVWEEAKGKRLIAVKKLNIGCDKCGEEARRSFITELKTLCKMRHRNLVKVLGYCVDSGITALVMEYMEKGDLDEHLHGNKRSGNHNVLSGLNWDARLDVALDVAEGLVYLHHEYVQPIIHCDLKPKNILIGLDMVAKITDFGIARLLDRDSPLDEITISKFRGTFGYAAPEYAWGSRVTTMVDVYSFGVLLMELISGVKPTSKELYGRGETLTGWVQGLCQEGRLNEALDPSLWQTAPNEPTVEIQAHACLSVAVMCTKPSARERPTMKDVREFLLRLKDQRLNRLHGADCYSNIAELVRANDAGVSFPVAKWLLIPSIETE